PRREPRVAAQREPRVARRHRQAHAGRDAEDRQRDPRSLAAVASWSEFVAQAPEIAARGSVLLTSGTKQNPGGKSWYGIGFMATVRPDGTPHLSPVCPIVTQGRMFVAAVPPKRDNLE